MVMWCCCYCCCWLEKILFFYGSNRYEIDKISTNTHTHWHADDEEKKTLKNLQQLHIVCVTCEKQNLQDFLCFYEGFILAGFRITAYTINVNAFATKGSYDLYDLFFRLFCYFLFLLAIAIKIIQTNLYTLRLMLVCVLGTHTHTKLKFQYQDNIIRPLLTIHGNSANKTLNVYFDIFITY